MSKRELLATTCIIVFVSKVTWDFSSRLASNLSFSISCFAASKFPSTLSDKICSAWLSALIPELLSSCDNHLSNPLLSIGHTCISARRDSCALNHLELNTARSIFTLVIIKTKSGLLFIKKVSMAVFSSCPNFNLSALPFLPVTLSSLISIIFFVENSERLFTELVNRSILKSESTLNTSLSSKPFFL